MNATVAVASQLEVYPGNKLWGVTQTIIITVITVLIILGNVTNIAVISSSLRSFSITGHFLISLAVADLGVGVLITPLCIGASIYHDWLELYGWWLCETVALLVAALCTVSIYSITLVTLDKYVYILHPLRYQRLFTVQRARLVIVLKWCVCFVYFLLHKLYANHYYYDRKSYICTIDFPSQWQVTVIVVATIVLPPAAIIVYCNYQTFRVARAQQTQIMDLLRSIRGVELAARTEPPVQLSQYKALKMNVLIAGAFYLAWMPYSAMQMVLSFKHTDMPQWLIFVVQWLAVANSCFNSLIYYYFNKQYKQKALQLYRTICCYVLCKPHNDVRPKCNNNLMEITSTDVGPRDRSGTGYRERSDTGNKVNGDTGHRDGSKTSHQERSEAQTGHKVNGDTGNRDRIDTRQQDHICATGHRERSNTGH